MSAALQHTAAVIAATKTLLKAQEQSGDTPAAIMTTQRNLQDWEQLEQLLINDINVITE